MSAFVSGPATLIQLELTLILCVTYSDCSFKLHSLLPYYYLIERQSKDGYTYVFYLNGGRAPWTYREQLRHFCSSVLRAGGLCFWFGQRLQGAVRYICFRPARHRIKL